MNAALRSAIAEDTFEDLKRLVYGVVAGFVKRLRLTGTLADDLYAEGEWIYLNAVKSYTPDHGASLGTWVRIKVDFGIRKYLSRGKERVSRYEPQMLENIGRKDRGSFDRDDLMFDLRKDAADVVRLVLDSPREVWDSLNRDDSPAAVAGPTRRRLRRVLDGMGWSRRRITKAFREIQEILAS